MPFDAEPHTPALTAGEKVNETLLAAGVEPLEAGRAQNVAWAASQYLDRNGNLLPTCERDVSDLAHRHRLPALYVDFRAYQDALAVQVQA